MFYIALFFLILLGGAALIVVVQNVTTLLPSEHLLFLTVHLPGVPRLLIYLLCAFLGGLLLYVFSAHAARRDAREIKKLRARVTELEKAQEKTPSGALGKNFVQPVLPLPGGVPTSTLRQPWQPQPTNRLFANPSPASSQFNMPLPSGALPPLPQQNTPRTLFPGQ